MSKIVVIGATSAIAEHCARLWAARGDDLFLVARNEEKLDRIVADLMIRGASGAHRHVLDLDDVEAHQAMLDAAEKALGGLDVALIAHGVLFDQKACEKSVALTLRQITTNALSVVSLLTLVSNRLEAEGKGAIAVISSVAGDRGRASNYVYGGAKAMVTTFASGLRQRLHKSGVSVVTIEPGFVDTPMTAQFRKGILWSRPERVARDIVGAIDRGKGVVYTPWPWRFVMLVIKAIPEALFKRLSL